MDTLNLKLVADEDGTEVAYRNILQHGFTNQN